MEVLDFGQTGVVECMQQTCISVRPYINLLTVIPVLFKKTLTTCNGNTFAFFVEQAFIVAFVNPSYAT